MLHFANTRDFKVALSGVIRHAGQPNPSRYTLAAEIESLAEKLGAVKAPGSRSRKKKPDAAPPVQRQVLVNIAQKEADRLSFLKIMLDGAVSDLKREVQDIRQGLDTFEVEAEDNGEPLDKAKIEAKWSPGEFFAGQILDPIIKAVDYLADTLEEHESITQETDLTQAVRAFKKKIPDEGKWPKGKGEEHFTDVIKAFNSAASKVPTGLTKASDLGKLRQTFEFIVDAIKLMTGKSIQVPKIPKALEPDDPRQLGFGFTASRIANTDDLKTRLASIWQTASEDHPSRHSLGDALLAVAHGLRRRS